MMQYLPISGIALLFLCGVAAAAPCAIGTTTSSKGPITKDTSSNVEGGSTANVTPGAKAESPGTVGALSNGRDNTRPEAGEKKPPEGKPVQGQGSNDC